MHPVFLPCASYLSYDTMLLKRIVGHPLRILKYADKTKGMRKLILEEWVSLDGFVADRNGSLDFFTQLTPEQNRYSDADQLKFLDSIDTILLGRKTYELFVDFWPGATTDKEVIADKLNETKKIIFSNTIVKAPWGKWPEAETISGNAIEAIKKLKSLPGKNMVMWGSISLAQSLMSESLIDEYHIQLCPVLTAGGRSLFSGQFNPESLNLLEVRHYNTGTVFLNYQRRAT
jgi:dihydrofolate reductase